MRLCVLIVQYLFASFLMFNLAYADFKMEEISDGIYIHYGKHVSLEHEERHDIANIGFIVGESCIAVIDTGGSIDIGTKLHSYIETHFDTPVCYVINTHVHFDHLLGNYAFKDNSVKFIGHHRLADALSASAGFFITNFAEELQGQGEEVIVMPDLLVEDTMTIDLGERELLLTAHPPAHTYTDLSIWDAQTKTLWMADLLFVTRIPTLDGSLRGWLEVMKNLKREDMQAIIPGHGKAGVGWDETVQAQIDYLQMLFDETQKLLDEGYVMEDIIETVGHEEKLKWQLHDHHRRNVSKAVIELEW